MLRDYYGTYSTYQLIEVIEDQENFSKEARDVCKALLEEKNLSDEQLTHEAIRVLADKIISEYENLVLFDEKYIPCADSVYLDSAQKKFAYDEAIRHIKTNRRFYKKLW